MSRVDIVFLHAPSIYDFRKKAVIHGPISDVVPSGPVFEMYPIGLLSLCGHLENAGYSTRIINIANKMLNSLKYDPEKEICSLSPKAFAIDLHWMPHVQGALAVGEIVKKFHPNTPVIYGGYSSTYFHKELVSYPFVDYVLKGDSTEVPMVLLMNAITQKKDVAAIPNLTYKDKNGNVLSNEITFIPDSLDYVLTEYDLAIRKTVKHFDLNGYLPFQTWMKYPVTAIFPFKGCVHNCKTCGGSRSTCEKFFNRKKLSVLSPSVIATQLKNVEKYINAPSMIIGDILQNGKEYAYQVLDEIKKANIKKEIAFEFFVPPSEELIVRLKNSIPKYNIEISPESHDEEVRHAFGRPFNNDQLENAIRSCVDHDCRRIDLFFMTGLPKQTYKSVMDTIDYCEYLLNKFGKKKNLYPFISPLAPFVDPGSEVWENPEQYGYRFFAKTLEEHRRLMDTARTWQYFLDYETRWMTREEIVMSTYEAGVRLNELKRKHGLISQKTADIVAKRAKTAVEYIQKVNNIIAMGDAGNDEWEKISKEIKDINIHTICFKEELNWPVSFYKFKLLRITALIFRAAMKKIFGKKKTDNCS